MTVTRIELYLKGKYKIYLNDEFAFVLYKGELKKYHIETGKEIAEADYLEIMNSVLVKRVKLRAMHILKSFDKTEYQLRMKLKDNLYPEEVIDAALEYVKSFHYVDDMEYARRYISFRAGKKSRKQMALELQNKGIRSEIIEAVLEETEQDESQAIFDCIRKKCKNINTLEYEEEQKLFRYLLNKGFSAKQIKECINFLHQSEAIT